MPPRPSAAQAVPAGREVPAAVPAARAAGDSRAAAAAASASVELSSSAEVAEAMRALYLDAVQVSAVCSDRVQLCFSWFLVSVFEECGSATTDCWALLDERLASTAMLWCLSASACAPTRPLCPSADQPAHASRCGWAGLASASVGRICSFIHLRICDLTSDMRVCFTSEWCVCCVDVQVQCEDWWCRLSDVQDYAIQQFPKARDGLIPVLNKRIMQQAGVQVCVGLCMDPAVQTCIRQARQRRWRCRLFVLLLVQGLLLMLCSKQLSPDCWVGCVPWAGSCNRTRLGQTCASSTHDPEPECPAASCPWSAICPELGPGALSHHWSRPGACPEP